MKFQPETGVDMDPEAGDAVTSVYLAFEGLAAAGTPDRFASAWCALRDAVADMVSFLPGYDIDTGTLTIERHGLSICSRGNCDEPCGPTSGCIR